MSIINDSVVPPKQLENQLISSNCISTFGCPSIYCPQPYPQPVHLPLPIAMKTISIEKVPNGYILKGYFAEKNEEQKRVATSIEGLTNVLREWAGYAPLNRDA